jgi:hypothetical protein
MSFRVLVLISACVFLNFTTGIIYTSRVHSHGIFLLPSNLLSQIDSPLSIGASLQASVSVLSAALFTTVVTVPLSFGTLDLKGILANANPLISNISSYSYDTTSSGVERIFPYTWVPTSSAGTLFGIVGVGGIFSIFLLMSTANMICLSRASWRFSGVLFKLAEISFFAQMLFFLEYSTRIWFRVFWAFWICFGVGILANMAESTTQDSSSIARNIDKKNI